MYVHRATPRSLLLLISHRSEPISISGMINAIKWSSLHVCPLNALMMGVLPGNQNPMRWTENSTNSVTLLHLAHTATDGGVLYGITFARFDRPQFCWVLCCWHVCCGICSFVCFQLNQTQLMIPGDCSSVRGRKLKSVFHVCHWQDGYGHLLRMDRTNDFCFLWPMLLERITWINDKIYFEIRVWIGLGQDARFFETKLFEFLWGIAIKGWICQEIWLDFQENPYWICVEILTRFS